MASISVGELFEMALMHQATQVTLQTYNINIQPYKNILLNVSNVQISTYNEYLDITPKLLKSIQPHLSFLEYQKILLAKSFIEPVIYNIFQSLV